MIYLYDACDQISDFCHQQLLRKVRRKTSWTNGRTDGRTDGQTDRGKTVYPSSPFVERGYNEHERLPNITLKTQIRLESKDIDVRPKKKKYVSLRSPGLP